MEKSSQSSQLKSKLGCNDCKINTLARRQSTIPLMNLHLTRLNPAKVNTSSVAELCLPSSASASYQIMIGESLLRLWESCCCTCTRAVSRPLGMQQLGYSKSLPTNWHIQPGKHERTAGSGQVKTAISTIRGQEDFWSTSAANSLMWQQRDSPVLMYSVDVYAVYCSTLEKKNSSVLPGCLCCTLSGFKINSLLVWHRLCVCVCVRCPQKYVVFVRKKASGCCNVTQFPLCIVLWMWLRASLRHRHSQGR